MRLVAIFVMAFALGCEPGDPDAGEGSDADSDGDSDADTDADSDADSDSDSDADSDSDSATDVCDELEFEIDSTPVNMIILLDRSGSMSGTKWTQAKSAIQTIVTSWEAQIRFGFDVFPDGSSCGGNSDYCGTMNPIARTCAPANASNIITAMNGYSASGGWTPLYCEMANFLDANAYGAGDCVGTDVFTYVVVVSDGADTCSTSCNTSSCEGSGVSATDLGLLAQNLWGYGIASIAIGFGAGAPVSQLQAIAENGGIGLTGGYFSATDGAALQAALDSIAASVVTCIYDIVITNEVDYDEVNFYFVDSTSTENVVPYDEDCAADTGWHWVGTDHTQIEFCEAACDQLQSGDVEEIRGEFGCPTITIE